MTVPASSKQPGLVRLERRGIYKTEVPEVHIFNGPRCSADIPRLFRFHKDKVNIVLPFFHSNIVAQLHSAIEGKRGSA